MRLVVSIALLSASLVLGACQTICYEGTFYTVNNPDHGTWTFEAPANGGAVDGEGELLNVNDDPIALTLGGDYEPAQALEVTLNGADGGEGFISFGSVNGQDPIEGDAIYTTSDGTVFNGGARGSLCEDN